MLQDAAHLVERNTGEALDELVDGRPVFEVLEECRDGHSRTAKDPGSAIARRVALHGWAA